MKVKVIQQGLLYRFKDEDGNEEELRPKIGDIISLPKPIAKKERQTGNVRYLLPEEKSRKKKTKKDVKKKKSKKG